MKKCIGLNMIPLRKYIGESVFDGKSEEDIVQNVNKLGKIARYCYAKNKNIFDGLTGNVQLGSNGIEIYAPMFPRNKTINTVSKNRKFVVSGAQEFVIESTAKKLDLGISKFQGNMVIRCKHLETLEGIFTSDCEFAGRLSIWYYSNLKSLKGLPKAIVKDPEIPGSQNGFLGLMGIKNTFIEPTQEQIEYLPKEMNELSWNWDGDIPNLIKRMSIRSQIIKHTNGLEAISLQGHYKRV